MVVEMLEFIDVNISKNQARIEQLRGCLDRATALEYTSIKDQLEVEKRWLDNLNIQRDAIVKMAKKSYS